MEENHLLDNIPRKEVYAQLFAILSNRRRNSDNQLIIGISEEEVSNVLNKSIEETKDLVQEFNDYLLGLGLSIVEYEYQKQIWICIKSMYAAPIELSEEELGVLGGLIMLTEEKEHNYIEQAVLLEYFVSREYFNEYRLRRIINRLIESAYVSKQAGKLTYGPRTLIELNEEVRRRISNQATDLLF